MSFIATLFALFDIPGTDRVFIGFPPVWMPLGMSNCQSHEFLVRHNAGLDLIKHFVREETAEARAVELESGIDPPGPCPHGHKRFLNPSIWDDIMLSSGYEGVTMVSTLNICLRHLTVSLVFEDTQMTGSFVPRGSMRGDGPNFAPWWVVNSESISAQYFRRRYELRLPQVRDMGWRVLRRMANARDIFEVGLSAAAHFRGYGSDDEGDDED